MLLSKGGNSRWFLFFVAFLLSSVFYFLATKNGNLDTNDSIWFKEIATSLATDYSYFREGVFVSAWPPLYPLTLALAHGNMDNFIHIFHWLCLLGSLFVWTKIGRFFLSDAWLGVFMISLSLATPLIMISVFVWSEIFFLLLFSAYLLYCLKFIESGRRSAILIAALFGFLMMLQRNAGFFLFAGSIAGLLANYRRFSGKQLIAIGLHAFLAITGFTTWNIYALLFKEKLDIMHELVPQFSPVRNLVLSFHELGLNFVPGSLSYGAAFTGLLIFVGAGIYIVSYGRNKNALSYLYMVLFFYMLTWLVIPGNEHEMGRFMAVVLPLFYLFAVLILSFLSRRFPKIQMPVTLAVFVWLVYTFVRLGNNVLLWGDYRF